MLHLGTRTLVVALTGVVLVVASLVVGESTLAVFGVALLVAAAVRFAVGSS